MLRARGQAVVGEAAVCMQRALIRDRVALRVMSEKESKTRNGDQGGIIIQEYRDC